MKAKSCAILGCNPMAFPWGYDEEDERCAALKLILLNTINFWRTDGMTSFAVPLDAGIGLYTAEIIGALCEKDEALSLTCVIPWEEQSTKWTPDLRNRYFDVQAECTNVETVSPRKTATCELEAKLRAIDLADSVFAVTASEKDTALGAALHYARRINKKVLIFDSEKIEFHN